MENKNSTKDRGALFRGLLVAVVAIAIMGVGAAIDTFYPLSFTGHYYVLGTIMAVISAGQLSAYLKSLEEDYSGGGE